IGSGNASLCSLPLPPFSGGRDSLYICVGFLGKEPTVTVPLRRSVPVSIGASFIASVSIASAPVRSAFSPASSAILTASLMRHLLRLAITPPPLCGFLCHPVREQLKLQ